MKKSILLGICFSIASSSFASQESISTHDKDVSLKSGSSFESQESIFTHDKDASLKEQLPIGTPSCEFTSIGKYPTFTTIRPFEKTIQVLLCGKKSSKTGEIGIIKKAHDLMDLVVLRKMSDLGNWFKKENVKYYGWRKEALLGQIIEKVFLPKRSFENEAEHPMITASKQNSVIFLTLQNNQWLKAFAVNMLEAFDKANFSPTKKLLLLLNFVEDPNLETLDKTTKEFLSEYFELVDPRNNDIKKFFDEQQTKFFDIKDNMSHCDKYIDENMKECLVRLLEKKYEDFGVKENIIKILYNLLIFEELYSHGFLLKLVTSPIKSLFSTNHTTDNYKN